jgi:hypothetical protein
MSGADQPAAAATAVPLRSIHQAEETHAADVSGPLSLIATIVSGFLVGISFLLCVTFSIQDPATVTSSSVNPVFNIAWTAFAAR